MERCIRTISIVRVFLNTHKYIWLSIEFIRQFSNMMTLLHPNEIYVLCQQTDASRARNS